MRRVRSRMSRSIFSQHLRRACHSCRHEKTPAYPSKSKFTAQRTQQLRNGCGETSADAKDQLVLAAAGSWAREPGHDSQATRTKPLFSGRLAAMLDLQRKLKLGTAGDPAVLQDGSSKASGNVGSAPMREALPAAAAQRLELSSEEQQLLHRAASGPDPVPSVAVDLSAFAEMPAIPAWRATGEQPLDGTLQKTFTIRRTEAAEKVSQHTDEP